jgi:hypothetical protein
VVVFAIVKIGGHLPNYDGLSIVMLNSRAISGLSFISVFAIFTSMNT